MKKNKEPTLCTCKGCGWVHMAYTRAQAEAEVDAFNEYFHTLSVADKQLFYSGKPSSLANYIGCNVCGRTEFRPFKNNDCPDGCTIGPVIWEPPSGIKKVKRGKKI